MGYLGPIPRIIIVLAAVALLVSGFARFSDHRTLDLARLPEAAIAGPFKVIFADAIYFDLGFKTVYLVFLIIALMLVYNGMKNRDSNWGQSLAVAGILLWVVCGWMGLDIGQPPAGP